MPLTQIILFLLSVYLIKGQEGEVEAAFYTSELFNMFLNTVRSLFY